MNVRGAIAFVSGANRGLGLAFARELLARGASKVYAGVRNPDSAAQEIAGLVPVALDVTDPASVAAAAARCSDVTLLVNNAGIARVLVGTLDARWIETAREIFETNFYGVVLTTQAFAPVLEANGKGAILNVLSEVTWHSPPGVSAYAASKSAAWSFTNATRTDLREKGIQVLGLHVGFIDTDMTKGFDMKKTSPDEVVTRALDALETGQEEVIADEGTQSIKRTLGGDKAFYLGGQPAHA